MAAWFIVNLLALPLAIYWHQLGWFKGLPLLDEVYAITSNLLQGGLISFLFYFLVVALPASRKKRLIKQNLGNLYGNLKQSILWQIVFASRKGGRLDVEQSFQFVEGLRDVSKFRHTFEKGKQANEGFYAFQNQMSNDTPEFREIVLNLEQLQRQVEYLLNNYDFGNPSTFEFFQRLDLRLHRLKLSQPGYDESKPLCSFLWEICSGWNLIDGYQGYDRIETMIERL